MKVKVLCYCLVVLFATSAGLVAQEKSDANLINGIDFTGEFKMGTNLTSDDNETGIVGSSYLKGEFNLDYRGTGVRIETDVMPSLVSQQGEDILASRQGEDNFYAYSSVFDERLYVAVGVMEDDTYTSDRKISGENLVGEDLGYGGAWGAEVRVEPIDGLELGVFYPSAYYEETTVDLGGGKTHSYDSWVGTETKDAVEDMQYGFKYKNRDWARKGVAMVSGVYQPSAKQTFFYLQPRVYTMPNLTMMVGYEYSWLSEMYGSDPTVRIAQTPSHTIAFTGAYVFNTQTFMRIMTDLSYTYNEKDDDLSLEEGSRIRAAVSYSFAIIESVRGGLKFSTDYHTEGEAYFQDSDDDLASVNIEPKLTLLPDMPASRIELSFKYNLVDDSYSVPLTVSIGL